MDSVQNQKKPDCYTIRTTRRETCKSCYVSKEYFLIEKDGNCYSCNYNKNNRYNSREEYFKPYRFGQECSGFRNS